MFFPPSIFLFLLFSFPFYKIFKRFLTRKNSNCKYNFYEQNIRDKLEITGFFPLTLALGYYHLYDSLLYEIRVIYIYSYINKTLNNNIELTKAMIFRKIIFNLYIHERNCLSVLSLQIVVEEDNKNPIMYLLLVLLE